MPSELIISGVRDNSEHMHCISISTWCLLSTELGVTIIITEYAPRKETKRKIKIIKSYLLDGLSMSKQSVFNLYFLEC